MTQRTRANILASINTLLADNVAGDISALDLRTVTTDDLDSALNILSDTSDDITEGAAQLFVSAVQRGRIKSWTVRVYTDGVDYTAGGTNSLTLLNASESNNKANVYVKFEGVPQLSDQWNLVGTTITFNSPIPTAVQSVEIHVWA